MCGTGVVKELEDETGANIDPHVTAAFGLAAGKF
jgi:hypothetical protein